MQRCSIWSTSTEVQEAGPLLPLALNLKLMPFGRLVLVCSIFLLRSLYRVCSDEWMTGTGPVEPATLVQRQSSPCMVKTAIWRPCYSPIRPSQTHFIFVAKTEKRTCPSFASQDLRQSWGCRYSSAPVIGVHWQRSPSTFKHCQSAHIFFLGEKGSLIERQRDKDKAGKGAGE